MEKIVKNVQHLSISLNQLSSHANIILSFWFDIDN